MEEKLNSEKEKVGWKKYVAHCPAHNWDGFRRDDKPTAELDLQGHIELFPDEDHSGSRVNEE